ncbi:hypothetical protein [Lysinibacillus capsici]
MMELHIIDKQKHKAIDDEANQALFPILEDEVEILSEEVDELFQDN